MVDWIVSKYEFLVYLKELFAWWVSCLQCTIAFVGTIWDNNFCFSSYCEVVSLLLSRRESFVLMIHHVYDFRGTMSLLHLCVMIGCSQRSDQMAGIG